MKDEQLVATLKAHWPLLECDHEKMRDIARCSCGNWEAHWRASIGEAIEAWAEHVDTVLANHIGVPNVPAIVNQAERLNNLSRSWADDTLRELIEMADADYDTHEQQIDTLAKTLRNFVEGEIAWREAGPDYFVRQSAPELLEALKQIANPDQATLHTSAYVLQQIAKAAIAKVTGETL